VKLNKMLLSLGHEVFLYGLEGSDAPCTEFIQVSTLKEIQQQYGDGDNRFELGYDWHKGFFRHNFDPPYNPQTLKFFANCIIEITKRKKPDDFLLLTQGYQNKMVDDAVELYLTCEAGIGYRGSYTKFRAFESSYMQNFTYGWQSNGGSINGNNYDRVIPNYFDVNDFEFSEKKDNYILYMGRVILRKGILTADEISKATGIPLKIAGQGVTEYHAGYLKGEDCELRGDNFEYVGYADKKKRNDLMSHAKATIVATEYLEPFGGISIESLLCGTPVITTDFGCFPETIPHGIVGYRCATLDHFVWATNNIKNISPKKCREYAEKNFSLDRVKFMYQEWFEMLYRVYESTVDSKKLGWHYIDKDRKNLDWLNKHY